MCPMRPLALAGLLVASLMIWDPSASSDATNCFYFITQQRVLIQPPYPVNPFDADYFQTYTRTVCGPPFERMMPPDPPPSMVQYFCLRARDTSRNYSECADVDFVLTRTSGASGR